MRVFSCLLLIFILGVTSLSHAESQKKADEILEKIAVAIENNRAGTALLYCSTLERLESSLDKPLPERFYYYKVKALALSGSKDSALFRGREYLYKYGRKSLHSVDISKIVSNLEQQARASGQGADADAVAQAIIQKQEELHQQTLQMLRACKDDAINLESEENELTVKYQMLNELGDKLNSEKASLDHRLLEISRADVHDGSLEAERLNFNRDSKAYNIAVDSFNETRKQYLDLVQIQEGRRQDFDQHCSNLSVIQYEVEEVCGSSEDVFCRSFQ